VSFEAAARPLRIAPSTFGLAKKSPQMTDLLILPVPKEILLPFSAHSWKSTSLGNIPSDGKQ